MHRITRVTTNEASLLSEIAGQTFLESHGHSASQEEINNYIKENYNAQAFTKELSDVANLYHFIFNDDRVAGFSKIKLNCPFENSESENLTKLERLYLLKEFYNKNLGAELYKHNVNIAKENKQSGIWLYVWKENERAVRFYVKNGFTIIGSHNFRISATHSNPNHLMLLKF